MTETDAIVEKLIALLEDFTQDWDTDLDGDMSRESKLLADLGFESVDIIQLMVAIEEDFNLTKTPFDKLLMNNGRYVDDLSIGQIADFLTIYL